MLNLTTFTTHLFHNDLDDVDLSIFEDYKYKIEELVENDIFPLILDDEFYENNANTLTLQQNLVKELLNKKDEFFYKLLKPWLFGKRIVSFHGRFSAGKSSIINSLINKDILPVDAVPTTAIPTYMTFDSTLEENYFYVVRNDDIIKKFDIDWIKTFKKDEIKQLGIPLNALIKYFIFKLNDLSYQNLLIIDSPGFDPAEGKIGKDRIHAKNTLRISDVVFFIIDINNGDIDRDSIKFLKENLKNDTKLYIILSKVDRKPPSASNKVADKIRKSLSNAGIKAEDIILFSSVKNKDEYVSKLKDILNKLSNDKSNDQEIIELHFDENDTNNSENSNKEEKGLFDKIFNIFKKSEDIKEETYSLNTQKAIKLNNNEFIYWIKSLIENKLKMFEYNHMLFLQINQINNRLLEFFEDVFKNVFDEVIPDFIPYFINDEEIYLSDLNNYIDILFSELVVDKRAKAMDNLIRYINNKSLKNEKISPDEFTIYIFLSYFHVFIEDEISNIEDESEKELISNILRDMVDEIISVIKEHIKDYINKILEYNEEIFTFDNCFVYEKVWFGKGYYKVNDYEKMRQSFDKSIKLVKRFTWYNTIIYDKIINYINNKIADRNHLLESYENLIKRSNEVLKKIERIENE